MIIILSLFSMFVQMALPGILLAAIIILFIRKKLIDRDKTYKILVYISIIFVCGFASCTFSLWQFEKPDKLYVEMQEFNDNQSLVGISEEKVIELLGEPDDEYNTKENKKTYTYYAGTIRKEWFYGKCYTTDYYELYIYFDLDEKVERTNIKLNNN